MMHFTRDDSGMLCHAARVMQERIAVEGGYEEGDVDVVGKLNAMGQSGSALVLTGAEQTDTEALALFKRIVQAELDNWVPDASQRLLSRAAHALGVPGVSPRVAAADCGNAQKHSLVADWVVGIYVRRCVTCHRLYPDGMRRHG